MRKFIIAGTIVMSFFTSTVFAAERLSLGYIYSASKSHSEIIEFTNNSVNVVSPTCFDITTRGRLDINGMLDQEFINEMHSKNIKVTPFLSNHWGRKRAQAALKNPYPLIEDLVTAINDYNLDGVNVDLENLDSKDKNSLTEFMRLLREALPSDKTLSIAVAPNPKRLTTTWVAAYDYKALAEYVDYMVVMTYDEHCYGGAAGPVAGINFVEESIKVILEEVSRDKIVMGIPLYGRFWQEGEDMGGEAIVIANVPRIIKKYRLVPRYSLEEQTPYVKLEVDQDETGPYINGRELGPGVYNIWYENENSIKAKLALVNKYNLLGAGLWALDNEDADFWTYYKDALNETPYESEKEIKIRERMEYAKKFAVVEELPEIEAMSPLEVQYIEVATPILECETEAEEEEIVKVNVLVYEVILPFEKKNKSIKIKRFYIDENNELKATMENLYYDTTYVRAVSTKALLVV
ncbi:MAG: hypothetical protein IJX99_08175 [Clostridia bacterium]|nr:hypothetical protein [Clostridia bacterium]